MSDKKQLEDPKEHIKHILRTKLTRYQRIVNKKTVTQKQFDANMAYIRQILRDLNWIERCMSLEQTDDT